MIDEKWCEAAKQSAKNAQSQFDIERHKLDLRQEFWRGYAACVNEIHEHLRRAQENHEPTAT